MDGITDEPFRLLQMDIAKPDFMFTEFVSAEGITKGGVKLYDQFLYSQNQRPIIAQLFGKDPESFYKSAAILCHLGFDGIDINMGCPAKTVTQNGSGAALINNQKLAVELIRAVKSGVKDYLEKKVKLNNLGLKEKTIKVIDRNIKYSQKIDREVIEPTISVKTRTGISESIVSQWIQVLLSEGLDFITLHGRTLSQGYSGVANWQEIKKAVDISKESPTKIIGNGDICSRSQGLEYCQTFGVIGVAVGRAAMGNPWLFANKTPTPEERFKAALLHAQLFQKIFPQRRFEPMRKNFLAYAHGLPNAKQLRSKIIKINSISDLLRLEEDFLG